MRIAGGGRCFLKAALWLIAAGGALAVEKEESSTQQAGPPQVPSVRDPSWRVSCERVRTKRTLRDDISDSYPPGYHHPQEEKFTPPLGGATNTGPIQVQEFGTRGAELRYDDVRRLPAGGPILGSASEEGIFSRPYGGHDPFSVAGEDGGVDSEKRRNGLSASPPQSPDVLPVSVRKPPLTEVTDKLRRHDTLPEPKTSEEAEGLLEDVIRAAAALQTRDALRLPVKSLKTAKKAKTDSSSPSIQRVVEKPSRQAETRVSVSEVGKQGAGRENGNDHHLLTSVHSPLQYDKYDGAWRKSHNRNSKNTKTWDTAVMSRQRRTSAKERRKLQEEDAKGRASSSVDAENNPRGKERNGRQKGKSADKQGRRNKGRKKPVGDVSLTATVPADDLEKELIAVAEKSNKRRKGKKPGSKASSKSPSRMHQHMEHKKKVRDWLQRRVQEQINQRRMRRNLIM